MRQTILKKNTRSRMKTQFVIVIRVEIRPAFVAKNFKKKIIRKFLVGHEIGRTIV